jgi:hypothetical protein
LEQRIMAASLLVRLQRIISLQRNFIQKKAHSMACVCITTLPGGILKCF